MSRTHPTLDRRQLLRIFGAVAAAGATGGLVAACGSDLSEDERQLSGQTIKVGLVVPSTGPFAGIGEDMKRGFELYLANNANLLGPHEADLRIVDEGETVESALAAVTSLLNQSVAAIVGVANPDALTDVALAVQDHQVPLVNTNSALGTLTNALFVWRVGAVLGDAGRSLGAYAGVLGSRAYALYEGSTTGLEEFQKFRTEFEDRGGTVLNPNETGVNAVYKQPGSDNLEARLAEAEEMNADLIFACFHGEDAAALLRAYRTSALVEQGVELLGTGSLTETVDLAALGPPLPQQVLTSMYYAADLDNDANRRFVTEYHRTHGAQPSGYAMAAYDGAGVLSRAAAQVQNISGSAINQAFSRLGQIESPRGTWTFNINRSPQQKWYLRRLQLDGMVPANMLDTDLMVLG